jgi:hypothetical protein
MASNLAELLLETGMTMPILAVYPFAVKGNCRCRRESYELHDEVHGPTDRPIWRVASMRATIRKCSSCRITMGAFTMSGTGRIGVFIIIRSC